MSMAGPGVRIMVVRLSAKSGRSTDEELSMNTSSANGRSDGSTRLWRGGSYGSPSVLLGALALFLASPGASVAQQQAPVATEAPAATAPPAKPSFFLFSDTQLSFWHEFTGAEPSIPYTITKNILSITHNDAWQYGTNFVNIDFLFSDTRDPAAPWGGPGYPIPYWGVGNGAFEVYATYRGTLSFNELTKTEAFKFGPVRDVSLYFGGDINTKNTAFYPQKRNVVIGLQLAFDVPGYFNVAAAFYKEWNHNGIVPLVGYPPGSSEWVSFNPTAVFEAQYMQPLSFTGIPLRFSGFTNVVLPKGNDGFGVATVTELLTDNRLTLDFGQLVAKKPNLIDVFFGYRFWLNKFGNDPYPPGGGFVPGTMESTFYVGVAWHIF